MPAQAVLAVDLGTTGNRVIAFSKTGEVLAKSYYEFSQILPRPGWVEHDPEEIFRTTLKALRDVLGRIGPENAVSLGITNQRETTILWDRNTGKPVHNAIVWQCRRTAALCRRLRRHAKDIKKRTGLFLDPYFSATKIRWLLDEIPGLEKKAKKGDILFGTPDTWVLWKLTGGKIHRTEFSNASRTLLLNIRTLGFDRHLLDVFGIPAAILPQVSDSDSVFGHTDKDLTGREIPVIGILGDQQASLFAQGGWEPGVVKNTYGTGLFVMTNTGEKIVPSENLISTIAWKTKRGLRYALEGSIFMGGATIQWLRDNLAVLKSSPESEAMAESLEDNEGVYFVPALQGLGAPYWAPSARGVIVGLTRKSSKENLARAALESLAYQTRDAVEEMKKLFDFKLKVLRVDGGACANDFLMQFQADLLGVRVERPAVIETTAQGAAGLSGIAVGFWTAEEFKKNFVTTSRTFRPSMRPGQADGLYRRWKDAVRISLRWKA